MSDKTAARTLREFLLAGQTGQDDTRELLPYSGVNGPKVRTLPEAIAHSKTTSEDSEEWFKANTPYHGRDVIEHFDELVGQFTGAEVRPRPGRDVDLISGKSGLQTKGYSEDHYTAVPQTFEELCLAAMDQEGKTPRE